MKYLIMCEGPNELEIIRMLLEQDKLLFTESFYFFFTENG